MTTVSSCLIVKNERKNIRQCLESIIPFSDQIIVYDTGSNDGTQDICKEYNEVTLVQGELNDDFSWARNQSFSYATGDYIFWLDADDIIDINTINQILIMKDKGFEGYDVLYLKYKYDQLGTQFFYRERFVKRSLNLRWVEKRHEIIYVPKGVSCYFFDEKYYITHTKKHETGTNLERFEYFKNKDLKNEIYSGRDYYAYGLEAFAQCEFKTSKYAFQKAIECEDLDVSLKALAYKHITDFYMMKGETENALKTLLQAVALTKMPRPDICCKLGDIYLNNGVYEMALMWYECALKGKPRNPLEYNFVLTSEFTTYPALQACVASYRLGDIDKSKYYNDLALTFDPDNQAAINNKNMFSSVK